MKIYRAQIAAFEAANPTVRVVFEPTSDEGYPAQLAAAFAAKQVPSLITHLPSFAAQSFYAKGLLEPVDDVIQAIGPERFLRAAGLEAPPATWDELREACRRMQRGGIYGAALPCRRAAFTARPCLMA